MAEMKSAVELAMEKLGRLHTHAPTMPLSDEQRRAIHELRQQYEAKIAEQEIMIQSEMRQLMQRRSPQEAAAAAQELQKQLQKTKAALRQELEDKIAAIRTCQ